MTPTAPEGMRLLPAVMIGAALLLALKVTSLVSGTSPLVSTVEAADAVEATDAGDSDDTGDSGDTGEADAAEQAGQSDAEAAGTNTRPPVDLAARPDAAPAQSADVLEALAGRRKALDQRERDVEMREKLLAAAEARIDEKIAELKALKAQVDETFKTEEAKGAEKLESLVKVYESMKPKEAAAVFERLDMVVLLDLLERMNERKLAAVLAAMDPARAQQVTVALATQGENRLSSVAMPPIDAPQGLPELEPILPEGAG